MTEAERVAAGLPRAQREAVLKARHEGQLWLVKSPWDMSDHLHDHLHDQGITGEDGWTDALTPLGLAVRTILKGQDDE